ncbi:MAG TPA: bifunctional aspartate kinase/homoserine dehydrogenase I [Woeseiaceae bacterium]|nr:bifunctional aspartate kinase/homoserine dehydrogenase I [Woeseiaceae bacterium]
MTASRWTIHKFGGSSLADAACIERVGDIIADLAPGSQHGRLGIVVSAMRGTTDNLLRLADLAESGGGGCATELEDLGTRYAAAAKLLLDRDSLSLLEDWRSDAAIVEDHLQSIAAARSAPPQTRDVLAGFGEIWSARLLAAYLERRLGRERAGRWIDAREVITVRQSELGPTVLWDVSRSKWSEVPECRPGSVVVFTGFIASDEQGLQTTLGRNGSDFSASILASLTGADELVIWTDVDGVMSADPNRVPEAKVIDSLSYNEAMELAYFGARVIHPQTLGPAVEGNIPVIIRNTFAPAHPGSRVFGGVQTGDQIKGITAIGGMALVNLEGSGMIGVPGTADRLFAALKKANVSVTLISQASSEHSICVAVPEELAERARRVIVEAFALELASGQIQSVDTTPSQSILAVVGDGMAGSPGIAGKFFGTLGRAGINVRAIAQGSSERNISAVVDTSDATRALRAVHSGFYLSAKTVSIGLVGPGSVGATLLDQLHRQNGRLRDQFNLDLRIRAIARSRSMLFGDRRIDLAGWKDAFAISAVELDLERFEQHVHADHLPHAAIIDCTASAGIAGRYGGWLRRGIHIVTPNKKAFSGDPGDYAELKRSCDAGGSHCFYEATVGAALPVIRTIRDLIDTGDRIRSVQGIFSGTLAYLFNLFDGSVPFSHIVMTARENGFTEPDPRDDLSGMDVARKLTILAREIGQEMRVEELPVENLVPEPLRDVSLDEFHRRLPEYDDAMAARYRAAQKQGKVLRYIARLSIDGEASVGLEEVDPRSAFGNINLTDNVVQFDTDRYCANPLVVQGPGAGPEVTAAGVFADVLRLAAFLGEGVSV